jgi:hypothetical protein
MFRSRLPSWRKTRIGLGSNFRISVGYTSPPRRPTYVPIALNTRLKPSGRSHAAVKAQIAPELAPPMARSLPLFDRMIFRSPGAVLVCTAGRSSSRTNFA